MTDAFDCKREWLFPSFCFRFAFFLLSLLVFWQLFNDSSMIRA